jgi:Transglycosylase SLT domain
VVETGPVLRKGVLLPRRNGAWATHLSCRNKGKVIIRVGKLSPRSAEGGDTDWFARHSRKIASVTALAASLAAFGLIMQNRHGWLWLPPSTESATSEGPTDTAPPVRGVPAVSRKEEGRYRALGAFVARKYRVSQEIAYDLVRLSHSVGHQVGLDPLLIIAVIAIESRFNPIAESLAGAKGLMQIVPKYHTAKFEEYGGEKAVFDPEANVNVGARILKEYIRLTGNVGVALQMYGGALNDGEEQYTAKVMSEQERLKQVVAPSSARPGASRDPDISSAKKAALDPAHGSDQLESGE